MPKAQGRYIFRTLLFMSIYVALNVAAILVVFDGLDPLGKALVAACVAVPVALQIWATLAQIKESDEFIRMMLTKQFLIAAGAAISLSSAWGFAESYAHAPHAPGWLVYILYNGCYGLTAPFLKTTRL
ncbi:hypothetical protein [Asticcacaulis sp. 201]|uniref:hypothetical protein n=1 Tax=Asticcacaulis sp. 201 TaxID=3028787 RepID=UPI00291641DD|nr:hypothetical protein [Asticcacaulis sp. 201]MDV6330083.1 hypothetical protein [Asticcacaulis sp. 201]